MRLTDGLRQRLGQRLGPGVRFFGQWLARPGATGSIVPSGKVLARAMAAQVPLDSDLPVLELGPGTGPFTAAMIERGVDPSRIVAVEFNPEFHAFLSRRFPAVNVIRGNAFDLESTLKEAPRHGYGFILSGLPLLNFPKPMRRALVVDCLSRVAPGGAFAQFSYGPRAPVPAEPARFSATPTPWMVRNVPPARIFVYRPIGGTSDAAGA